MARTYRNLWPQLVSRQNLLLAYRRCRRRKRYKSPAVRFHFHWEKNLAQLRDELINDCWRPGEYHHFPIADPKPRMISAAPFRDRIVHHAIVNVLEPLYERRFIHDSYACRRDKGTHRAIKRAQYYLRRHRWYLKTDIVKFFPSVDHEILIGLLERTIRDPDVMRLIRRVVASGTALPGSEMSPRWFPGDDLLAPLRPKGLPIGNLTSQFFANVLLDPVDHFIKEDLRMPGYVRYADDLLLFGNSKRQLWMARDAVIACLASIRLRLHPHKTVVRPSTSGVTYLGFRVFRDQCRLAQATGKRFNRRRKRWAWQAAHGELDYRQVTISLACWLSHAANANCTGFSRDLIQKIRLTRQHGS